MVFQPQEQISQKLDTISQSFSRLTDGLQRAYTLVGNDHTLMRNLLDAVPCGILVFDMEFCLYYANKCAETLFGDFLVTAEDKNVETLKTFYSFRFPTVNNPEDYDFFGNIFNGEGAYFSDVILCEGDQEIPVEIWIHPEVQFFDQQYIAMIVLDISERKKIEKVLLEKMRMEAEFKSADRILQALLPEQTPLLTNFELAARCFPASSIGGDFYDWYLNENQELIFTLGDVMGKELSAGLIMTIIRSALRTTLDCHELNVTLEEVADMLIKDFEQLGSFTTIFHGRLQPQQRTVFYVSAGHTSGFMLRSGGQIETLGDINLPLGVQRLAPYRLHQFQFQKGDRLILYTRGIVHSYNPNQLDLINENLAEILGDCYSGQQIVDRLFEATDESGKYHDRTVIALSCIA